MIKFIFLDIDGVLNNISYSNPDKKIDQQFDDIDDSKVLLLKQIVEATNAKIVLSSTWRSLDDKKDIDCFKMYLYLQNCLAKHNLFIYDKTPFMYNNRPLEIKNYLWTKFLADSTNIYSYRYVSLDDDFGIDEYKKYDLDKCLVKTTSFFDPNGGLNHENVEQAINILNRDSLI